MTISRRGLLAGAAVLTRTAARARAQNSMIKIGVLNDRSGIGRDSAGPTDVACVRQAVEEFGPAGRGFGVEVISADHQQKADIGLGIAREWLDQGVDLIIGLPNSGIALAVQALTMARNKVSIVTDSGSSRITGDQCSPNGLHWTYDTYMLARSTARSLVERGGRRWYFITANYAFGYQLQKDATAFIERAGGQVLGTSTHHPFAEATDFSQQLLKAQASGAEVLGLANAITDTQNCIKQAAEFSVTPKMKVAALLMFITDVHAIGLEAAQGLVLTESFYWDLNDRTRAFTKRVLPKTPTNYPNMQHAGCYSGTLHYLKAVADVGVTAARADGRAVVERMKAMPVDDDCFATTSIRADGRVLVPAYLFEVKRPSESGGEWDLYKLLASTAGAKAFRPLSEGQCPFVKA